MGNPGRFGKYGDSKRRHRLREAALRSLHRRRARKDALNQTGSRLSEHPRPSPPIEIRDAEAADVRFIGRLSHKAFHIYGPYQDLVTKWFQSGKTTTLIALLGGRPVGFAMISPMAPGKNRRGAVELLAIAVEPERRRRGAGALLMKEMEAKAVAHRAERIILHTAVQNIHARGLFTMSGYRICGIRHAFYPAGQDALEMCKEPLGPPT